MPPYDFQLSPETQKLLELINQQAQQEQLSQNEQSAQPVQQPVEPPDTKQQIDNAVLQGANPQRPSYLLPQAQHPLQNEYQQAILANKMSYAAKEAEYKAAQDEATRQGLLADLEAINKAANTRRDIGNAAGMDLSSVGQGVSLEDAMKNLETQRAKALAHMTTGRYSMTTDQFWQSEYDRHIMAGVSDSGARLRANRAAREYQAQRVAYLNGLYNNYGREGLVTTPLGNEIMLKLAADDPTAANFYGQIYPNAKEAYERQNKLDDEARKQANELKTMFWDATLRDMVGANADARGRVTFGYQQQILKANQIELERFKKANKDVEPSEIDKLWNAGLKLANINGYVGNDAIMFAREFTNRGILDKRKGNGTGDDKTLAQWNARYKNLMDREKNIREALNAGKLSEEETQKLQNDLAGVQAMIKDLDVQFSQISGGEETKPLPPYTGNDEQDLKTVAVIIESIRKNNPNATRDDYLKSIKAWIRDKDSANPNISETFIEKWFDEVVLGKKDTSPQTPAPQTPKPAESKPRKSNDKPVAVRPWEKSTPLDTYNPKPTTESAPPGNWNDNYWQRTRR